MKDCKYIIFEDGLGDERAVLFPAILQHSDVARGLFQSVGTPLSAGFVEFCPHPYAQGESITLRLRSRDGDSRLIAEQLGMELP